jgi:hypothetical protein
MRARVVVGSVLLVLAPLLAACGGDDNPPKAGDIIQARLDDQFRKGREAEVALPTGRLLIHAGEPVKKASGDDTRTREEVAAPSGSVMVPITWQYDPWSSGKLDTIFDTDDTPVVDLVSGEEHYRLTPPRPETEGAESFYVVVAGDGSDRSLEISFDDVAQTVDLSDGSVDKGDAEGLYDITDDKLGKLPCDKAKWFNSDLVAAEFTCELHGPVLTPYASGKWAPEGMTWLAVTVTTTMRAYGETDGLGGGARYLAGAVRTKPTIDDAKPASVISTEEPDDQCPAVSRQICGWSKQLVFAVPADDPEQGPLDLDVTYKMVLATSWNGYEAPKRKQVEAAEKVKIWK